MKYSYPAVFYDDDNQVAFHFYDREDWFLCAENIFGAIEMAEDVLSGALLRLERDGEQMPTPTPLENVKLLPNQIARMIEVDTAEYAAELEKLNEREAILKADNPIRELLNRRGMKIKQLSNLLQCPYRTCQDWALKKSQPPAWVLNLILDKVLISSNTI